MKSSNTYAGRNRHGNMIVLVSAITVGIIMAILFFALKYVRFVGSNSEQKTAIDAAALAAAKDISRIIVDDPNFGYISLSDYAPVGKDTDAQDKYALPVRSINTILATIRLDMIIADQTNNADMKQLAVLDYNNAMESVTLLTNTLNSALSGTTSNVTGGGLKDINGNAIDPYGDAVAAYQDNQIRLSGDKTSLVPNSMKLSLGCVVNSPTNTPIPTPSNLAEVPASQQINSCYEAYVDTPYDSKSFVFSAVSTNTILADPRKFVTTPAVPYFVPSIVKAEADQTFADKNQDGASTNRVVHAVACAEPACIVDPRPAPGALTISFPDGQIPEITKPKDITTWGPIASAPITTWSPRSGDYPGSPVTPPTPTPPRLTPPTTGKQFSNGIYDWLRRGGARVHITAAVSAITNSFGAAPSLPVPLPTTPITGSMNAYEFGTDGSVVYTVSGLSSGNLIWVSDHQIFGTTKNPVLSNTLGSKFDAVVTDEVYQPGNINGGLHGGEPLATTLLTGLGSILKTLLTDNTLPQNQILDADYGAGGMGACGCSSGTSGSTNNNGDDTAGPAPTGCLSSVMTTGWCGLFGGAIYDLMKVASGPAGGCNTLPPSIMTSLLNGVLGNPTRNTYAHNGSAVDVTFHKSKLGWAMP